jgi:fatty-acyl-CoA synthase
MNESASHVCGTTDTPLLVETIGAFLDRVVLEFEERPALVCPAQGLQYTYATFRSEVDRIARGLLSLGLKRGDRIGIWSANRAEWVLTQFAAARVGLVLVTINPAYRVHEAEHALRLSGCKAVVAEKAHKTADYYGMLRGLTRGPAGTRLPDLVHVIGIDQDLAEPGWITWAQLQRMGDVTKDAERLGALRKTQFDDPINIQFTSGTTGAPKGATLSHQNILNNGYFVGETLRLTAADRLCLCVPLYHCFGLVMGVLGAFTHGSCVVLAGEGFDPQVVLDIVAAENCSVLYGVPTMFVALLEEQSRSPRKLDQLRTGIMAGAPCPERTMQEVMSDLGMREVTICYGMTETSPVSFQSQVDDPMVRRIETVGRVHPHVEAKVVDAAGVIVPRGQSGELLTRGYSVMLGYWNDAARTREGLDSAGWMHTGDLAVLDAEGYCRIVGRIKDMLIRGGENVYPREIEEFLFGHEAVAEVHVFGVPDERYGEEVCAWVRLKPGHRIVAEELRAWCRDRIAHYKVPRYVEFVDDFPMTVTGKVQKHLMREEMARRLDRKQEA